MYDHVNVASVCIILSRITQ